MPGVGFPTWVSGQMAVAFSVLGDTVCVDKVVSGVGPVKPEVPLADPYKPVLHTAGSDSKSGWEIVISGDQSRAGSWGLGNDGGHLRR